MSKPSPAASEPAASRRPLEKTRHRHRHRGSPSSLQSRPTPPRRLSRFLDEPDDLCQLLDKLRPLRGHQQVDQWHQLIAAKDWPAFLESILRDHYDLCYRPAGSEDSNYQKPSSHLEVTDHSDASFQEATQTLLSS